MVHAAKKRARKQHVACTITVDDIIELIGEGVCPIRGVRYDLSLSVVGDDSATLEKFYPNLGYVAGNCFVISGLANKIKTSATTEQVRRVADWMERQERIWDEGYLYLETDAGRRRDCSPLFSKQSI